MRICKLNPLRLLAEEAKPAESSVGEHCESSMGDSSQFLNLEHLKDLDSI